MGLFWPVVDRAAWHEWSSAMVCWLGGGPAALVTPAARHRTEGTTTERRPRRVHFAMTECFGRWREAVSVIDD
jgi:hypothetical protein